MFSMIFYFMLCRAIRSFLKPVCTMREGIYWDLGFSFLIYFIELILN